MHRSCSQGALLPPQNTFLQTKFQVGSCKSDRVTYAVDQKVFHSSDVPAPVLEKRKDVNTWKKPDILGVARSSWDQSTVTAPSRKQLARDLLLVRAGLVDQPYVAKQESRKEEDVADLVRYVAAITGKGPVGALSKKWFNATDHRGLGAHCIEPSWPDWNCSYNTRSAEDLKLKNKRFLESEARRKERNVPSDKLNKNTYLTPSQSVQEFGTLSEEKKIQYADVKEEIKAEIRGLHPLVSDVKLQAMAQRMLDEKLMQDERDRRYPQPHVTFKPNLALTTCDRRHKEWRHPGKWAWNETEEKFLWSCCVNYTENSRGCEYVTVNPDQWNYFSGGCGSK